MRDRDRNGNRTGSCPQPIILAFAVLAIVGIFYGGVAGKSDPGDLTPPVSASARLLEIHDGDTVSLAFEGKTERARLIGIDAPELGQAPWGSRAKRHLKKLLGTARVGVRTDVEERDKYGRLLVYLWSSDGTFVNLEMIRQGYAHLYTLPPNIAYAEPFRSAQQEAREEKRGIWGKGGLGESPRSYRRQHPR